MRFLLFLMVLAPGPAWAQTPWKLHAGVGLTFPGDGPGPEPFLEASAFVPVLEPLPPEFFQAGARVSWDSRGVTASAGVRHKLYLSPWRSTAQEVLVGRRFAGSGGGAWTLSGRFGFGVPWSGRDGGLPATDVDLVWEVGWGSPGAPAVSAWGLALGLGLGPEEP